MPNQEPALSYYVPQDDKYIFSVDAFVKTRMECVQDNYNLVWTAEGSPRVVGVHLCRVGARLSKVWTINPLDRQGGPGCRLFHVMEAIAPFKELPKDEVVYNHRIMINTILANHRIPWSDVDKMLLTAASAA